MENKNHWQRWLLVGNNGWNMEQDRSMKLCWRTLLDHITIMWFSSWRHKRQHLSLRCPVNSNLPINPTLNIDCVSVAAIFHTWQDFKMNRSYEVNHRQTYSVLTQTPLWGTLNAADRSYSTEGPLESCKEAVNILKMICTVDCQQTFFSCLPSSGTRRLRTTTCWFQPIITGNYVAFNVLEILQNSISLNWWWKSLRNILFISTNWFNHSEMGCMNAWGWKNPKMVNNR